jgi:FixJ family two-component response regulator
MTEAQAIVFVVDDDEGMRQSLKNLVGSVGRRVEAFASAQEFLRSKVIDVPGCLVLDVRRLPGLSGLDLQKRIADAGIAIPSSSSPATATFR